MIVTSPGSPLALMRERRAALKASMDQILEAPTREQRNLLASESRAFDKAVAGIQAADERIAELEAQEQRSAAAASVRKEAGVSGPQFSSVTEPATYQRGNNNGPSYFKDLYAAQRGDFDAMQRLQRNNKEQNVESRALGNTGGTGGSGGEMAPPAWLIEDYVKLARAGRVTADLFHKETLPPNVSSVNLPRVATGTTTAVQSTQNTALSQTDVTTNSLSSAITTIGGKQVVSQQLLDQSAVPFDQVILGDLAADYARQLGVQVLSGTGSSGQLKGFLTPSSTNIVTWTQASPTVAGFYGQLAKLQSQIVATRYLPPDTVVMHPRRWAWFASGVDSANRPLVVPDGQGSFNTMAATMGSVSAGHVGSVLGMDVYTDPNIPTNLGAGTNQDVVLCFPREDVWFWESEYRAEVFVQSYADSLGVLFRLYNYSAMIPDRYLASLGQISGTGLVTPTFAS